MRIRKAVVIILGALALIQCRGRAVTDTSAPSLTPRSTIQIERIAATRATPDPTVVIATREPPRRTATPEPTPTLTPRPTETPKPLDDTALHAAIGWVANGFLNGHQATGIAIAVVIRNPASNQLETKFYNYGYTTASWRTRVNQATIYEIGSISKVFTADLLALLLKRGAVNIDDPIQKYLPANLTAPTYNGQGISLRDLATHRSGLPRNMSPGNYGPGQTEMIFEDVSDQQVFDDVSHYQLTRAPGSQYEYSNFGYSLLAALIERYEGQAYDDLVTQQIAKVLDMPDTRSRLTPKEQTRLAQGYLADGTPAPATVDQGEALGAGGLRSTTQDLAKYLVANMDLNSSPLGSVFKTTQQSFADGTSSSDQMGLAWNLIGAGLSSEVISKDGGTAGYNSLIWFTQDRRVGFVALTNSPGLYDLTPSIINILQHAP